MSWCAPPPCQPYQPLPISTGTIGYDRCGNVEVYAAPSVVRAPVPWPCWPIPNQNLSWPPGPAWGWGQPGVPGWGGGYPGYPGWGLDWWWWWMASGGIDPGFTAPPWWGPNWPYPPVATPAKSPSIGQAAQAAGTARATWALDVRNTMKAIPR